jgi:hypothetical protein
MNFLTINQDNYLVYLILLIVSCVILTVYKDWLLLTPSLIIQFFALAVIANELNGTTTRTLLGTSGLPLAFFLKMMSGVVAGTILFLSGYAILFEKRRNLKQEEVEKAAGVGGLRRFFFAAEKALLNRFRFIDYLLPLGAVVIAAGATYALSRFVPFSGNFFGDFAFYWLFSIGIAIMVVGRDVLKIGAGLLTALNGADLLYALLKNGDSPLVLGVSAAITILLALLVSYLAILLYNKMQTLNLGEFFKGKRKAIE